MKNFGHVLVLYSSFFGNNFFHADTLKKHSSIRDSVVSFMYDMKINIYRPEGLKKNQQADILGHIRMHCRNYQTFNTPEGSIFASFGPIEDRRRGVSLLRQPG